MKSKQIIALLGVILVAMIAGLVFMFQKARQLVQAPQQIDSMSIETKPKTDGLWKTKSDVQGAIAVEVTPINLSSSANQWQFEVVLNTHSESLDQDMTKITELIDDSGKTYPPFNWEGDPAGGHHRSGTLAFPAITLVSKSVTLKLSDIGGFARSFTWQIK